MASLLAPASLAITLLSLLAATSIPMGYPSPPAYFLNKFWVSYLVFFFVGIFCLLVSLPGAITVLRARPNRPLVLVWAAFVLWMGLASALSPLTTGRMLSFGMWLKTYLLPSLFGWIALVEARRDREGFTRALRTGLLTSGVIFFGVALMESVLPGPMREYVLPEVRWWISIDQSYQVGVGSRFHPAAGLFAHYNLFGVNQALCLILLLSDWKALRKHRGLVALVMLFFVGMVISTSKTAILGLAGGLCALGWAWSKQRVKPWFLASVFLATCLVGVGVSLLNPDIRVRFQPLLTGDWSRGGNHLMNGRFGIYGNALDIIRAHPLKGIGVFQTDNYLHVHSLTPLAIHNHNLFLEYGVAGGLIGLSLFLVLVYLVVSRGKLKMAPAIAGALAAFLFAQLTDVFVAHELWYATFLFILLGAGYAAKKSA